MDTIAIGVPGMLLFLAAYGSAFLRILRFPKAMLQSSNMRAIYFGTVSGFLVLFWTYLFYGNTVIVANPITFTVLFYAALFSSSPEVSTAKNLNEFTSIRNVYGVMYK